MDAKKNASNIWVKVMAYQKASVSARPTLEEINYLSKGVKQPGGKLPLFDEDGQAIKTSLIRSCLKKGWVEQWFANPMKPDWLVCRLTHKGRALLGLSLIHI